MAGERVYVFLVQRRGGKPERVIVWDTQDVSVGRAPENDVVLEDPEASRTHARFRKDGANFVVDSHSTSNATFVNGETVTTRALQNKDVVKIAETEFLFFRVTKNPVTLGLKTEYASQLKGFGPKVAAGDGEATILGLVDSVGGDDDEEFQVRPASDFNHELNGMEPPPRPRNLDLELDASGAADLDMPAQPARDAGGSVSLTLELQGLSDAQRRWVGGLLGKVIELSKLRIRIKGTDLG
jgi:hypothetical protein